MDEELEITRGKDSHRLLENPLLKEALEAIKSRTRKKVEDSLPSQKEVREGAYWLLCAVKELEAHLTSFVNTGKLASTAQAQRIDIAVREREIAESDGSPDGVSGIR
jgi:hypothetical protein